MQKKLLYSLCVLLMGDKRVLRRMTAAIEVATVRTRIRCEEVEVSMTHIGGYPRRYDPRAIQKIKTLRPRLFICGRSHILHVGYDL